MVVDEMLDILYGMVEDGIVQKINNFSFALPVSNFCKVLLLFLPAPPRPGLVSCHLLLSSLGQKHGRAFSHLTDELSLIIHDIRFQKYASSALMLILKFFISSVKLNRKCG